jgi:hypothetical protein
MFARMCRSLSGALVAGFVSTSLTVAGVPGAPLVDLRFNPQFKPVEPLEEFQIDLVADAQAGPALIATIDALLVWDPAYVEFLGVTTRGGQWFASGFFTDPEGLNTDLTDGDALWVALAQPGNLPAVPPARVCTKLRFRATSATGSTTIELLAQDGAARTRVLGEGIQNDVTGDISGASTKVQIAPRLLGDMNCDGFITVSDIGPFVLAVTDPAGYAAAYPLCNIYNGDINDDDALTVSDIGPFVALVTGG